MAEPLSGIDPKILEQARNATGGLIINADGTVDRKGGDQEKNEHSKMGAAKSSDLNQDQPQGKPVGIEEAFKKVPIIGAVLFKILNAFCKLFGVDLKKLDQQMAEGMSLGDAFGVVKAHIPEWAYEGLDQVMAGVQQIQQNPLQFRKGLRMMAEGVQNLVDKSKENGVNSESVKHLEQMQQALEKMAKSGPFGALKAARQMMTAMQGLKQAFEQGDFQLQQQSGVEVNLSYTEAGEELDGASAEIEAFERDGFTYNERHDWVNDKDAAPAMEETSKDNLKAGLEALRKSGAVNGVKEALADLASQLEAAEKSEQFLQEAQKAMQKDGQTAENAFQSIQASFNALKDREEGEVEKNQEDFATQKPSGDEERGTMKRKVDKDLAAAAEELGNKMKANVVGDAANVDFDAKSPTGGGRGPETTKQKAK